MKLEAGKSYITKGGLKVRVLCTDAKQPYPVVVLVEAGGAESLACYHSDGRWADSNTESDIVGPWVEKPVFDRSLLPPWCNKAIAMDQNGRWWHYNEEPTRREEMDMWGVTTPYGESQRIPAAYAPKWEGDWKDSLLVWEDEE